MQPDDPPAGGRTGTQPIPPSTVVHIIAEPPQGVVASHAGTQVISQRPLAHSLALAHGSPTFLGMGVCADGTQRPLSHWPASGHVVVGPQVAVH